MSRRDDGGWLLEAHPVDEFPGLDPTQALPSALSAALKGWPTSCVIRWPG